MLYSMSLHAMAIVKNACHMIKKLDAVCSLDSSARHYYQLLCFQFGLLPAGLVSVLTGPGFTVMCISSGFHYSFLPVTLSEL